MKIHDNQAMQEVQKAWNENPLWVIAVASGAVVALSKIIDAVAGVKSKRAYARRMGKK